MALDVKNVAHSYGASQVLSDISFQAAPGKLTCLLGASGCGKSTLLSLLAGILPLQAGALTLDGAPLARPGASPPPEARSVGLVFQEGALFPHMSVAQNIAYGLSKNDDRDGIVATLLGRMGLADLGKRYPHTLSGGQQQRVALARALAPAPRVMLLDEPFANIDIVRRRSLREETAALLADQGCISIMVTHDPDEAVDIGDHIVVMEAGQIVGQGTPADLYDHPASPMVGQLIGGGTMVDGVISDAHITTPFGDWPLASLAPPGALRGPAQLLVREEAITVTTGAGGNRVHTAKPIGNRLQVRVRGSQGDILPLQIGRDTDIAAGDQVTLSPLPGTLAAFPAAD